jgi:acetolactate synthase-1/3 small subunit
MEQTLYTIIVFTENRPGILNQVSIIFARRRLNIESLNVSASSIHGIHKFTITAMADQSTISKVVKELEKRIDVLKAYFYTDSEIIYQETALYKVDTEAVLNSDVIEELVRKYNARFLEITRSFSVIEMTAHTDEIQEFFDALDEFGVMQFVRSGRIAITKSTKELLSDFLAERKEDDPR